MNKIFPLCAAGSILLHSILFIGEKAAFPDNGTQRTNPVRIGIMETVPGENRTTALSAPEETENLISGPVKNDLSPGTDTEFPGGGLFEVAGIQGTVAGDTSPEKRNQSGGSLPGELPEGGSYPSPLYPEKARINGIEGTCILRISADETGNIAAIEIIQSSGSDILDRTSIRTVEYKWKFPEGSKQSVIREFEYKLTR